MTTKPNKERTKCEIYSRVVGYLRPTSQWNKGKTQEFKERKNFKIPKELIKEMLDAETRTTA